MKTQTCMYHHHSLSPERCYPSYPSIKHTWKSSHTLCLHRGPGGGMRSLWCTDTSEQANRTIAPGSITSCSAVWTKDSGSTLAWAGARWLLLPEQPRQSPHRQGSTSIDHGLRANHGAACSTEIRGGLVKTFMLMPVGLKVSLSVLIHSFTELTDCYRAHARLGGTDTKMSITEPSFLPSWN